MRGKTERLFERFRSAGDGAALARVLERTGGEVYRVARSVARSDDEAADLLQDTWLAVLESRDSWDSEQRLMPWILGILANQYRRARQAGARRSRHFAPEPPAEDPAAPRADQPDAAASARDLSAAVRRAIDGIREPFRIVVEKTLLEHKGASEIADELDREAVTVRGQLHRGMALLRRALPVGAAGSLAVSAQAGAALVRVHQSVLDTAADRGWITTRIEAGPVVSSTTRVVLAWAGVGILVSVAIALLATVGGNELPGVAPASPETAEAEPRTRDADSASRTEVATAAPTVTATAETDRPAESVATAVIEISLAWPDGTPAHGVGVRLAEIAGDRRFGGRRATSDAAGKIRFEGLRPVGHLAYFDRGFIQPIGSLATNKVNAMHRVIPEDGVTVHGTVVDAAGQPVGGATLWSHEALHPDEAHQVGTAASDGSFECRSLPLGFLLGARHELLAPSNRVEVERTGENRLEVTLKLAGPAAWLRGEVVDTEQRPVPNARIEIGPPGGWRDNEHARNSADAGPARIVAFASADGQFEVRGVPEGHVPVRVTAPGFAPSMQGVTLTASAPIEQRRIVLAPGARIRGVVTSAAGDLITGARLRLSDGTATGVALSVLPLSSGFVFDGLAPGEYQLEAAMGPRYRSRIGVVIPAGVEEMSVAIAMPEIRRIHGTLLQADGSPCDDWRLRAVATEGGHVAEGHTDFGGRFEIGPCEDREYEIFGHAVGANGYERCGPGRSFGPGGPYEIRLDPEKSRGSISGVFVDVEGRPIEGARITVRQDDMAAYEVAAATDADGVFELNAMAPGDYLLALIGRRQDSTSCTFELAPGEAANLGEVRARPAGRLRLEVRRADGKLPWRARVKIAATSAGASDVEIHANYAAVDKGLALPAGEYVIEFTGVDIAKHRLNAVIEPGGTTTHRVTLESAVSRDLMLRWAPGESPTAPFDVILTYDDATVAFEERFETEPFWSDIKWPSLPLGQHTVELREDGGTAWFGTCSVAGVEPDVAPLVVRMRLQ